MADVLVLTKNLATGVSEAISNLQVDNTNGQIKSLVPDTGTAPMTVLSTTVVTNFNADQLDGEEGTYYTNFANHSIASEAQGDILYRDGSGWARLAKGNDGEYLKSTAGNPTWDTPHTLPTSTTQYAVLTADNLGSWTEDTGFLVNSGTVTAGAWNGTAIDEQYGGLGGDFSSTAINSMLYFSAQGQIAALAPGTDNYVLRSNSGVPTWEPEEALPSGTTNHAILVYDTSSTNWIENTNFTVDDSNGHVTNGEWRGTTVGLTYGGTGSDLSSTGPGVLVQAGSGSNVTVETLAESRGGTGQTTYTAGDILYASAGTTLSKLGVASGSAYEVLRINSAGTGIEYGDVQPDVGGTGLDTSSSTGVPYISSGTWSVDSTYLSAAHGGTGGDSSSSTGVAQVTSGTWSYDAGLTNLGDVTITSAAQGDILYRGASGWANLGAGTSGLFLKTQGAAANPIWADPGTEYNWEVNADSGGPQTITDGDQIDFAGGNGISTALTGGPTTFTNTISVVSDTTTGGDVVPIDVTANGIGLDITDIDGTGLTTTGSGELLIDVNSTVNFGTGTPAWTFDNGTTAEGLFVTNGPVDGTHVVNKSYVDSLVSGLTWKDPASVLNMLDDSDQGGSDPVGPSAGDTYVVNNWSTQTDGDIVEYSGSAWVVIVTNSGGAPPAGTRVVVSGTSGTTPSGSFGAQAKKIGTYNSGWTFTSPSDGWALLIVGESSIYENAGYTYDAGSWVQFTGAGQITAGVGLTKSGNTINIGTGSTGDLNGINRTSTDISLAYSSTFFKLTSNQLDLVSNSIGATEIDETDSYTWTTGTHDFQNGLQTDTISESTGNTGVTVDSCLIKDGVADASSRVVSLETSSAAYSVRDVLYLNGSGKMAKAQANSSSAGYVYGVAKEASTAADQSRQVFLGGGYSLDDADWINVNTQTTLGYSVGNRVYVSKVTAGTVHNSVSGFVAGDWVQCLGVIMDTTNQGSGYVAIKMEIGEPVLLS